MSANIKLVTWWLACSVIALIIIFGFTIVRMTLNWHRLSRFSTPVHIAQLQLQRR
jgi:branched-subunit amino acid transport protein AzlD